MLIDSLRALFSGYPISLESILMQILATLFVIFCILPLHEYAHGWMAERLGDHTARYAGRLTLNPLASLDPIGALFLLLFGFGWAKPVPVDTRNFKKPKRDMALTALAGPVSNLLASLVGAILYYVLVLILAAAGISTPLFVQAFFSAYITINVALAVFNLLPIPPLDGSKIVGAFLSNRAMYAYYRYQNIIVLVLFLLLFSGVLSRPLAILENWMLEGILWIAELPFRLFGLL
ncbi:MAG TPA: site-2 protease family protein [Firmicutes bacterium]|nr:site-2 protease family protein [Bacillota bacterium]